MGYSGCGAVVFLASLCEDGPVVRAKAEAVAPRRKTELILLGSGALCFVVLAGLHWRHICDDAFIYFRYADHVVAGWGPVWNRGEPVEGYSSPLWLGLLVIGRALGAGLPGWAGALGVAFAALALVFVHRLALVLSASRLAAAWAVAASALLYPLYFWMAAGLETAMFTALMATATWALVARRARWLAATAALLGVARPEGPALVGALLVLFAFVHGRSALRPGLLVLALAPVVSWLVFRRVYYGEWLPNTYYAKASGELMAKVTAGAIYALPGLASMVATAVAMGAGGITDRPRLASAVFAGLPIAGVIFAGGDWMWHGRMLLPALPPLLAHAVAGVAAASSRRRLVLVLASGLGWFSFLPRFDIVRVMLGYGGLPPVAFQEGTMIPAAQEVARYIHERYAADALVAVNHAGALPRALPNPSLDMTGLCDHHIAHDVVGGLHHKYDADYVLRRRPRLIVLNSRVEPGTRGIWYHPGYWAGETALVNHPAFTAHYHLVPRYWAWQWIGGNGGFILLYERIG